MRMGAELPQDGELPGRTTGYWVLRQTSNPFPSPAPQFGQCERMESSVITGLNAARLSYSKNCAIRVQQCRQANELGGHVRWQLSASFPNATTRCHSVRCCLVPLRSVKRSVVASEKFATFCPDGSARTSGSRPRFPTTIALLIDMTLTSNSFRCLI